MQKESAVAYYSGNLLEGLGKTAKVSHGRRSLRGNVNMELSEY
jgi:hypothetical protein